MEPSAAVEARIREEAAKLETFYERLMSCRVVVEIPHHHHQRGNLYHIRVDLGVPGGEIVVKHEPSLHSTIQQIDEEKGAKELEAQVPHKDIYVAIRDVFKAARRQLQDYARRQRAEVKTRQPAPRARVSKLFPEEGYGFLETPEGLEIYFHKNSVLHGAFDRLEVGIEVSYAEEEGEQGPQASTVKLVGKHQPSQAAR
jgi:cold shock CspA family protein